MTTYHVYSTRRQVCTTHDKSLAETIAASVRGGYVVTVERAATFRELQGAA